MSSSYRIIVAPQVAVALEAQLRYIAERSPQNALAVAADIDAAFDSLRTFPSRFSIHRTGTTPSKAIRRLPVVPFVIFYHVSESRKTVSIVKLIHGRQQRPRRFM